MKRILTELTPHELIEKYDPFTTIFFYDQKYHRVINCVLCEISHKDAEALLAAQSWDLWNIGTHDNPPGELPESCPVSISVKFSVKRSAEYFMKIVFKLSYKESFNSIISKN